MSDFSYTRRISIKPNESNTHLNRSLDENDKISIPVNPNSLQFYEHDVGTCYKKQIYLDISEKKLSEELCYRYLVFYVFISLNSVCIITFSLIAYFDGKMEYFHMLFHILANVSLLILSYTFLFMLKSPNAVVSYHKSFYTIIGILECSYYILGNRDILNTLIAVKETHYKLPLNLSLLGLTLMLRLIFYNNF